MPRARGESRVRARSGSIWGATVVYTAENQSDSPTGRAVASERFAGAKGGTRKPLRTFSPELSAVHTTTPMRRVGRGGGASRCPALRSILVRSPHRTVRRRRTTLRGARVVSVVRHDRQRPANAPGRARAADADAEAVAPVHRTRCVERASERAGGRAGARAHPGHSRAVMPNSAGAAVARRSKRSTGTGRSSGKAPNRVNVCSTISRSAPL